MSTIKQKTKEFAKNVLNEDKLNTSKNNFIFQTKELIKKLLHNSLNSSLLKLESNSVDQMTSLKISNKSFNEFSKIINNLCKNVEEMKKKKSKEKEKERKTQVFKRGRKMVTESNLNTNRSKTIESNLMKFKNKVINIDGKKNMSNLNKKNIIIRHKTGNRTMSSFRNINEIEKEQDYNTNQKMHRFKNISFQNTSQNFRKGNNKIIPVTPVTKLREKDKNKILAKTLKSKKVDYKNERNNHSRTFILSHLTDIDEINENIKKNSNNINQKTKFNNKNVKRIIYKNENKNRAIRINYQTEKDNEINKVYNRNIHDNLNKSSVIKTADDILDIHNNNINNNLSFVSNRNSNKNINIQKTNELKNIVKLVDDVNENLNRLLKDNHNTRRSSVKDFKYHNKSTNTLINAIKDVNIQDLHNISLDINDPKNNNGKNSNIEIFRKGKTNISKSYSLNYKQMSENIINIKEKERNIIKSFRNKNFNDKNIKQKEAKRIKSFTNIGCNYDIYELNESRLNSNSYKNIFEKQNAIMKHKKILLNEKKKMLSFENHKNNNDKEKIKFIKSIIQKILDITNKKIEIIKKQKNCLINKNSKESNTKEIQNNNLILSNQILNLSNSINKKEIIIKNKTENPKSEKKLLKNKLIFSQNYKNKKRKSKSFKQLKK